ncbi:MULTISPECIES: hypothetical protein [unclassified Streptomyces]|uniref:hypothetical protein n=1 Tax=unclassified Streptomyces TaxID=2593676 RepID=UPI003395710F
MQLGQVSDVLERYPISALETCRDTEGGDVVDGLLGDFGTESFERVRQVVRQALARHRADGGPHVRIAGRRSALRDTGAYL